jgi:hypothetical protein
MPDRRAMVEVQVGLDADADAEELEQLSTALRREPLELGVEDVDRPPGGRPPPGTRALEVPALGMLLVTLAKTPDVLGAVVGTVRAWLTRGAGRSARVKLGDDEIELTGISSEEQERLITAFVARHAEE